MQISDQRISFECFNLITELHQHLMLLIELGSQFKTDLLVLFKLLFMLLRYSFKRVDIEGILFANEVLFIYHLRNGLDHFLHLNLDRFSYRVAHLLNLLIVIYGPVGILIQLCELLF